MTQRRTNDKRKPLTHAERGRLATNQSEAGKIGGKVSRGGGRPRIYATASERQKAYRDRKKAKTVGISS